MDFESLLCSYFHYLSMMLTEPFVFVQSLQLVYRQREIPIFAVLDDLKNEEIINNVSLCEV